MGFLFGGTGANQTEAAIGSFKVMSQGYNVTIPVVMGTNRLNCVLIDVMDYYSIAHESSQGGKGGGSGSSRSYTYYATVLLLCCEGGGAGVNFGRLWVNKDLYVTPDLKGLAEFDGADGQTPWAYMVGKHPDHALTYKGFAYLAAHDYELTNSASIGNHSVEVQGFYATEGAGGDASMANCITGLLLNQQWGCDFGAERLLSLSQLNDYCQSYGIVMSPALTEQVAAHELLTRWATIANCGMVWTENAAGTGGALKFVPYSQTSHTGNGHTFNPIAPLDVHLTDDDHLDDGDTDPVICNQGSQAQAFNATAVEFLARNHEYNKAKTPEARDAADIELYGYRPDAVFVANEITLLSVANTVAKNLLQRSVSVRNTYTSKVVGWEYAYLEPMDVVYLTDAALGMSDTPILIIAIDDNDDELFITFEELPDGIGHTEAYASDDAFTARVPWNVAVGNSNAPVIFHAPAVLTKGGYEVWIAISNSDENYGGCQIWASFSGSDYKLAGSLNGNSTHGVLTADFVTGDDPDTNAAHELLVDLSLSGASLATVSQTDAENYHSLCLVGNEFVAYRYATLTGSIVDLTTPVPITDPRYLRRGLYGSTKGAVTGATFVRCDNRLFKLPFLAKDIGSTLSLKFLSYNQFGQALQSLADVSAYTIVLTAPLQGATAVDTYYQWINE